MVFHYLTAQNRPNCNDTTVNLAAAPPQTKTTTAASVATTTTTTTTKMAMAGRTAKQGEDAPPSQVFNSNAWRRPFKRTNIWRPWNEIGSRALSTSARNRSRLGFKTGAPSGNERAWATPCRASRPLVPRDFYESRVRLVRDITRATRTIWVTQFVHVILVTAVLIRSM